MKKIELIGLRVGIISIIIGLINPKGEYLEKFLDLPFLIWFSICIFAGACTVGLMAGLLQIAFTRPEVLIRLLKNEEVK